MSSGPIGSRVCAVITALNGAFFGAGLIITWLDRRARRPAATIPPPQQEISP